MARPLKMEKQLLLFSVFSVSKELVKALNSLPVSSNSGVLNLDSMGFG